MPLASCRRAKVQDARGCAPRGTASRSLLSLDSAFEGRQCWELLQQRLAQHRSSAVLSNLSRSRLVAGRSMAATEHGRKETPWHRFTSKLTSGSHSITTAEGSTLLDNSKDEKRHWLPRCIGNDALSTSLPRHVEAQARHTVPWRHLRHQSYVVCPSHVGVSAPSYPSSAVANGLWTLRPPIFDAPSSRPLCIRHHQSPHRASRTAPIPQTRASTSPEAR